MSSNHAKAKAGYSLGLNYCSKSAISNRIYLWVLKLKQSEKLAAVKMLMSILW